MPCIDWMASFNATATQKWVRCRKRSSSSYLCWPAPALDFMQSLCRLCKFNSKINIWFNFLYRSSNEIKGHIMSKRHLECVKRVQVVFDPYTTISLLQHRFQFIEEKGFLSKISVQYTASPKLILSTASVYIASPMEKEQCGRDDDLHARETHPNSICLISIRQFLTQRYT